jgi:chromosome segregation protein
MHFSRLRLAGFKSFVDPTELIIDPGTTGVVGPNGCGKSNLVEAIRWVMGETSAKRMRGGEMDDVIFSGTSNRPARNLAEVQLELDNADRSAPAQFNEDEKLEVSRRIEREQGSRYLVNGHDVRARDVQLLFADANAGAQSTALVSQGKVGAIINAKPQERRGLLEEAAGIRGLHSRRHEAELRLRAAETNLERVDDVIQTLEVQLKALKRQARQANRYRNISGHLRRAEAMLFHLRWVEAAASLETAQQQLAEAERGVADLTATAAQTSSAQTEAAEKIPPLRETEAAAAATLHRLAVERDRIEDEEKRTLAQQEGLAARLRQIEQDHTREQALLTDARSQLERLAEERAQIEQAQSGEAEEMQAASATRETLAGELGEAEKALQMLTEETVEIESRRTHLGQLVADGNGRLERLNTRLREMDAELAQITAENPDAESSDEAEALLAELREAAARARRELLAAETAHKEADAAEQQTRETLRATESDVSRLDAETNALAGLLKIGEDDLWPPLVDAVSVEPGYEAALGAALGDDLNVADDIGAPVHWRQLAPMINAPTLPYGAEPISTYVKAPPVLARRLSQIGLVTADRGAQLAGQLAPGQRLVTREGALWRWDGFTAAADATTPATTRLNQRTRLAELRDKLKEARRVNDAHKARHVEAHAAAARTGERAAQCRDAAAQAEATLNEAHEAEAERARQTAEIVSRIVSLREGAAQLRSDIEETTARIAEANNERDQLPPTVTNHQRLDAARSQVSTTRNAHAAADSEVNRLRHVAASRAERLSAIGAEVTISENRVAGATSQMAALKERRYEVNGELTRLENVPTQLEQKRRDLISRIEHAEAERREAADALARAEKVLVDRDAEAKTAREALAEGRENRVRFESAVEQNTQHLKDIAAAIRERLECDPQEALAKAEHKEDQPMPDASAVEAKIDRIKRERDGMGPVNLRAEIESEEIGEQITTLQTEREDLVQAIARLRQGISSLNREGRERLLASFEQVNTHFKELFVKLFGGGRAHLALTESDDPLQAGLEIMASPPGKRLQKMSLLSGGEQALTALSLLFAVFRTNPAPVCVLDEVDAPLDESNVERFCDLVDDIAHNLDTRFLVITHNSITMARMDRLYGVTMEERGVSQLVSVDLARAEGLREVG